MPLPLPCLFGAISRHPGTGDVTPTPPGAEVLKSYGGRGVIFATPNLLPLSVQESGNRLRLLFGLSYGTMDEAAPMAAAHPQTGGWPSEDALRALDGSFVLIDVEDDPNALRASIAVDKYGTRRLYYRITDSHILFASHMAGIEALSNHLDTGIPEDILLHYYNFGFTPADASLLPGVRKLPLGSRLIIEDGAYSVDRYFDIRHILRPATQSRVDETELCRQIDTALGNGITRRAASGEAVGISLSGGVDSGYIAQKLHQTGAVVRGYNISYDSFYNEEDRVDFLAQSLGIEVTKIRLTADEILDNFEQVNAASSEPAGFNGTIMRFAAAAAKRDGLEKLFDGDGADRLFLGMNRYLGYLRAVNLYDTMSRIGLAGPLRLLLGTMPKGELFKLFLLFSNWRAGIPPYPERKLGGIRRYDESYERKVFALGSKRYYEQFLERFAAFDFGLFFTYQSFHMCPEMFFHASSEMMTGAGVSAIPAFFNDDLVELAFNIPTEWKLRDKKTKYILRQAAAQNMDRKYWMLPKIGLQSAFDFVLQSERGKAWYRTQEQKVLDSREYAALSRLAPGQDIEPQRLVPLIAWRAAQA